MFLIKFFFNYRLLLVGIVTFSHSVYSMDLFKRLFGAQQGAHVTIVRDHQQEIRDQKLAKIHELVKTSHDDQAAYEARLQAQAAATKKVSGRTDALDIVKQVIAGLSSQERQAVRAPAPLVTPTEPLPTGSLPRGIRIIRQAGGDYHCAGHVGAGHGSDEVNGVQEQLTPHRACLAATNAGTVVVRNPGTFGAR